jgi:hypothetical protein
VEQMTFGEHIYEESARWLVEGEARTKATLKVRDERGYREITSRKPTGGR